MRTEVQNNEQLIAALAEETDRQRTFYGQRYSSLLTRASVLAAAASILTGLRVADGVTALYFVSIAAAALAAISGGLVLLPRRGGEVNVQEAERTYWNEDPQQATRDLTGYKLKILKEDEKALFWRARVLFWGFALLAASIVTATISLIIGH